MLMTVNKNYYYSGSGEQIGGGVTAPRGRIRTDQLQGNLIPNRDIYYGGGELASGEKNKN